jgi:hypothetical protein
MNYKFETQKFDIDKYPYFFINPEEDKYFCLTRFSDSGWTPAKVQEIIDGVESAKTRAYRDEYLWANEDLELYANENGVLLIDMMAQRGGGEVDVEASTLQMQHDELIAFLEDFKQFVAENQ